MHAPHNSKCGTNRTQAHPHNTKQCTFCTHFTFALTISTYTPIWALFPDPLHKKVPDQHICMHPTIPSVVPIDPGTSPPYKTVHFLHSFQFALTISTYTPIWALFLDPFTKKCRTSIYARTPQFQVWYQWNPGTSPQYKTVQFLHLFHIRTHHKHLYTDLGLLPRP